MSEIDKQDHHLPMKKLVIAVDFDGTLVVSNYPDVTRVIERAKRSVVRWFDQGHTIIINTCRSKQAELIAVQYLVDNDIPFDYCNENTPERIKQYKGDTRKMSADLYIDDLGIEPIDWDKADRKVRLLAHPKPLVFAVVGESGTGKSRLAEYMEEKFCLKQIQSYTTRPKRKPNETGHTFVSEDEMDVLMKDTVIAKTVFGGYRYCCLRKDVYKWGHVYVIDESGLEELQRDFSSEFNIVALRLTSSVADRLKRGVSKDRIERDKGMFPDNIIYDDYYTNLYDDEMFLWFDEVFKCIMNEY